MFNQQEAAKLTGDNLIWLRSKVIEEYKPDIKIGNRWFYSEDKVLQIKEYREKNIRPYKKKAYLKEKNE